MPTLCRSATFIKLKGHFVLMAAMCSSVLLFQLFKVEKIFLSQTVVPHSLPHADHMNSIAGRMNQGGLHIGKVTFAFFYFFYTSSGVVVTLLLFSLLDHLHELKGHDV